ncbi:hypothetical protein CRG98_019514 [Punica granatum]|uniref:Uncharacterized protein n=1 Tax=Punica granatum TaxID=22663 RepID=A0A2I0JXA7_PUNGR|nr:hypothetical protein CRG98_019514 [Punica granatum]
MRVIKWPRYLQEGGLKAVLEDNGHGLSLKGRALACERHWPQPELACDRYWSRLELASKRYWPRPKSRKAELRPESLNSDEEAGCRSQLFGKLKDVSLRLEPSTR